MPTRDVPKTEALDFVVCRDRQSILRAFPVAAAYSDTLVKASLRPDGRDISDIPHARISAAEAPSAQHAIALVELKGLVP